MAAVTLSLLIYKEFFDCTGMALGDSVGTLAAKNVALKQEGGVPFAKDKLENWYPFHRIENLNDGLTSNDSAWVAGSPISFAGVRFSGPKQISSVAFSRDDTGRFSDRCTGTYTVQFTTTPEPNADTPDNSWETVGTTLNPGPLNARFCFPTVIATGVRVVIEGTANPAGGGNAIDELEVYGADFGVEPYPNAEVIIHAEPGHTYEIEVSNDLKNWVNIDFTYTFTATQEPYTLIFPIHGRKLRYFRTREQLD